MKRILALGIFVLALALTSSSALAQETLPAPKQSERIRMPAPAPVKIIDLAKPIPAEIELNKGQTLIFENDQNRGKFTVKDTDGKGKLLSERMTNGNQNAAFQADRVGEGEITIFFPVQGLLQVTKTVKIKLTVKEIRLPIRSKSVDLGKALPNEIELEKGQTVVFTNGQAKVTAADTDGKGTLMSSRPHNTFDQVAAFQATRVGTGEFTVTFTENSKTVVKTIKITVK